MNLRTAMLASVASIVLSISPALAQNVTPEVPFVPTPDEVVDKMLELAEVQKGDVVYDLGSGDGRIVIAAAKEHGAQAYGVDIDPQRIKESEENAKQAGVAEQTEFINQDLFETDLSKADVVTLYLLPRVNLRLRPKLLKELQPGARIVSHSFDMGDWKPEKTAEVDGRTVYLWVVPEDKARLSQLFEQEQQQ